jgi:hypothetical protein
MTAIAAVRLLLRPTRLTLFLLAAGMALIATFLLSSHSALACETSRPRQAEHQLAGERQVHRQPHLAAAGKKAEAGAASASRRSRILQSATSPTVTSGNGLSGKTAVRNLPAQFATAAGPGARIHQRPLAMEKAAPASSAGAPRPVAFVARAQQRTPARSLAVTTAAAAGALPAQQQGPAEVPPAPVALPALPATPTNSITNPASPSRPSASSPAYGKLPLFSDVELTSRLESALSVAALACSLPLLAIVVLLQLRLLRMRQPAKPSEPAKRYYSLTQEQARELAPDLLAALAHHRFCESDRHYGRQKRARWLELDETEAEVPNMWATCETCHHQRMTSLGVNDRLVAR